MIDFEGFRFNDDEASPNRISNRSEVLVALKQLESDLHRPIIEGYIRDHSTADMVVTDIPKIIIDKRALPQSFTHELYLPETFDITDFNIGFHQSNPSSEKSIDNELGWFFGMKFKADYLNFVVKADKRACTLAETKDGQEYNLRQARPFVAIDLLTSMLGAMEIDPASKEIKPAKSTEDLEWDIAILLEKFEEECECRCNKFLYCPAIYDEDGLFMQIETTSEITINLDEEPKEQTILKEFTIKQLSLRSDGIMADECNWKYENQDLNVEVKRKTYATKVPANLPISKIIKVETPIDSTHTIRQLRASLNKIVG